MMQTATAAAPKADLVRLVTEHMITWRRYMQHMHFLYHVAPNKDGEYHHCSAQTCKVLNAERRWYGCEQCGRTHFCRATTHGSDACPVRLNDESYAVCCISSAVLVSDGPALVAGTYEESVVQDEKLYENASAGEHDRLRVAAMVADARRANRRAQFSASTLVRRHADLAYRTSLNLNGLQYQADVVRIDKQLQRQKQRRQAKRQRGESDGTVRVAVAEGAEEGEEEARASKRIRVMGPPPLLATTVDKGVSPWIPPARDLHYWTHFESPLAQAFRRFAAEAPASAACLRVAELAILGGAAVAVANQSRRRIRHPTKPVSALAAMLQAREDAAWLDHHVMPMPTIAWRQSVRDLLGRAVAWAAPSMGAATAVPTAADLDVHVDRLVRWVRLLRPSQGTERMAAARGAVAAPPAIVAVAVYLWHLAPVACVVTDATGRRRMLYQAQAFFTDIIAQQRLAVAFGQRPTGTRAAPASASVRFAAKAVAQRSVELALGGATAADARRELHEVDERNKALRRSKQRLQTESDGASGGGGGGGTTTSLGAGELEEGRPTSVAFAPEERCTAAQIRDLYDLLRLCVFSRDVAYDGAWFTDWFLSPCHQCWPPRHMPSV